MRAPRPRSPAWLAGIFLGALLCPTAAGAVEWLRAEQPFPRAVADPREPHVGLAAATDPTRIDAALGLPVPILSARVDDLPVHLVLEAGAFLRLGKDGSFFPLETVDGLLGLGFGVAREPWHARLRLLHVSAHKADGDSTISYPGFTYSRETAWFDVGYAVAGLSTYTRLGVSWHAVPEDAGLHTALGGTWRPEGGGPVVAVHLEADAAHAWRIEQNAIAGWSWGREASFLLALRYARGDRPHGQYWRTPEIFLGLEFQFSRIVIL